MFAVAVVDVFSFRYRFPDADVPGDGGGAAAVGGAAGAPGVRVFFFKKVAHAVCVCWHLAREASPLVVDMLATKPKTRIREGSSCEEDLIKHTATNATT